MLSFRTTRPHSTPRVAACQTAEQSILSPFDSRASGRSRRQPRSAGRAGHHVRAALSPKRMLAWSRACLIPPDGALHISGHAESDEFPAAAGAYDTTRGPSDHATRGFAGGGKRPSRRQRSGWNRVARMRHSLPTVAGADLSGDPTCALDRRPAPDGPHCHRREGVI
jgi:hypothetical protein